MFIGHYSVPFAARSRTLSLGWLFVATQALDFLFCFFVIGGIEHLRIIPGFTATNPYDLYDMAISHSLVTALGWGALVALAARPLLRLSWRDAAILGAVAFLHYVLDVFVHTPDLPLAPGSDARLGLGLWNHRWLNVALELAFFGAAVAIYVRRWGASRRLGVMVAVMTALLVATSFFPDPTGPKLWALQALLTYVALAVWARWVDRSARA